MLTLLRLATDEEDRSIELLWLERDIQWTKNPISYHSQLCGIDCGPWIGTLGRGPVPKVSFFNVA
jgi:hypothetical protein